MLAASARRLAPELAVCDHVYARAAVPMRQLPRGHAPRRPRRECTVLVEPSHTHHGGIVRRVHQRAVAGPRVTAAADDRDARRRQLAHLD